LDRDNEDFSMKYMFQQ